MDLGKVSCRRCAGAVVPAKEQPALWECSSCGTRFCTKERKAAAKYKEAKALADTGMVISARAACQKIIERYAHCEAAIPTRQLLEMLN